MAGQTFNSSVTASALSWTSTFAHGSAAKKARQYAATAVSPPASQRDETGAEEGLAADTMRDAQGASAIGGGEAEGATEEVESDIACCAIARVGHEAQRRHQVCIRKRARQSVDHQSRDGDFQHVGLRQQQQ